jgi:hypothetical protein
MILDGRQPKGLRLAEMLENAPLDWNEQRRPRVLPGRCGMRLIGPLVRHVNAGLLRDQDAARARGWLSTSSGSAPGAMAGSAIVKVEPAPGALSTVTSPPSIRQ